MEDDGADVAALVTGALGGDHGAWNDLVHRYAPLVATVLARYRLYGADRDDVSQIVWLRLVEHLKDLRTPRALPKWIVTTTRNECLRCINASRRTTPFDPLTRLQSAVADGVAPDQWMVQEERRQLLLEALAELPERQRALLLLQFEDPDISYAGISRRLDMPIGSIGPTRARAIEKLRASPALQDLDIDKAVPEPQGGGPHDIAAIGRR
jgi:RNA polymerase sigma factor (sigma-70 family)